MKTTSLSGLFRDKRAQAAAAAGAVIGLIVFVRKGGTIGSAATATDATGSNGSLGGMYAGSSGGAAAGGTGGSDASAMEAYTAQLSSIAQLLANLAPASLSQPTTATASPTATGNITSLANGALSPAQVKANSVYDASITAGYNPGSALSQAASAYGAALQSSPAASVVPSVSGKLKYLPTE